MDDTGDFLAAYYRHVPEDDLIGHSELELRAAAAAHRRIALLRPSGTTLVRTYAPDEGRDGWDRACTVVDIVTDDMPFLVDSVLAQLTGSAIAVNLLVHPQLRVTRDGEGRLETVDEGRGEGGPDDESWMHLELAGMSEADMLELQQTLRRVLDDVAVAVGDWQALRAMALSIAAALPSEPGLPGGEVAEAVELLRWMADDHFTFLGYREYVMVGESAATTLVPRAGTGLGLLRGHPRRARGTLLSPTAVGKAREPHLLVVTKANSLSTVQRRVHLDYISVKVFDAQGGVTGERRFIGLLSSSAYVDSVRRIPLVRGKVDAVLADAGVSTRSHSGKRLLQLLETYPRDELFQVGVDQLASTLQEVAGLGERRKVRLFVRRDDFERFVSCLVYLPRDRYTTSVRERMSDVLKSAFAGESVEFTARVTESVLARLHFVVRSAPGATFPDVDVAELERRLADATREWADRLGEALVESRGSDDGARLSRQYADAFPEAYKEDVDVAAAVEDVVRLDRAERDPQGLVTHFAATADDGPAVGRYSLYRFEPLSLSVVLPLLQRFGVEIVDERPYTLHRGDGSRAWIYSFGLRSSALVGRDAPIEGFQAAYAAVARNDAEDDGFNALVLTAGLSWRQVSVLRTYWRYLRQIGQAYSQDYVERALGSQPALSAALVDLFEKRFDPEVASAERADREAAVVDRITALLEQVPSLDHDRIFRGFLTVVRATTRTNFYMRDEEGRERRHLSVKLDGTAIPELPLPHPRFEIFVCSPDVEGVHLRMGVVARGGLRWSDRPEDFRTEVLGLVKAQAVKNAVIVPAGAKGGFVVKRPLVVGGIDCYSAFIRGLLDVTDNRVGSEVVAPAGVVRHDGDDAYLVVAADKGTARFSDIANAISLDYGFWLGDAFASGGSAGYDHKAMGITARGAWESVKRHMLELGLDTQTQDFSVVGVGDMSGDVFGNGMLLSRHIRLLAAFDHRHIFLDPTPDAEASFVERSRLAALDRSSWADYDQTRISHGGGVHARNAKSVKLTESVRRALGLAPDVLSLPPNELVRAILRAPVDVVYNGGIGTYVKAADETDLDVGDKANDGVRVDGRDLRCRVVAEGGNLGLTQRARIEASQHGVRLNTDAIDNSAGVDTSDHEVNIKILLDAEVAAGSLPADERNPLLAAATDEVAAAVLVHNYQQNALLAVERAQAAPLLEVNERFMSWLEVDVHLDRSLEALPSSVEVQQRQLAGTGLTNPESCVLVAYAKTSLQEALRLSTLPDDAWYAHALRSYFPRRLGERFADRLQTHPLRREIVTTGVANALVDRGGTTFVFRACEETGATEDEVVRAATVASEVFGLSRLWVAIDDLDRMRATQGQALAHLGVRRLLDRATRWWLQDAQRSAAPLDVAAAIERFAPQVGEQLASVPELLGETAHAAYDERRRSLCDAGVPAALAEDVAALLDGFALLDAVKVTEHTGRPLPEVARLSYAVLDRFDIDTLLTRISALPRLDRWQSMVRSSLRYEAYAAAAVLCAAVLTTTGADDGFDDSAARIAAWETANVASLARARTTLREVLAAPASDLAALSVALRALAIPLSSAEPG